MKRILSALVLCGLLSACDDASDVPTVPSYVCGNYTLEMTFSEDGGVMHAVISGDAVDLVLSPSASGAKYVGMWNSTNIILWGKGNLWTMFLGPDETMIECSIK